MGHIKCIIPAKSQICNYYCYKRGFNKDETTNVQPFLLWYINHLLLFVQHACFSFSNNILNNKTQLS